VTVCTHTSDHESVENYVYRVGNHFRGVYNTNRYKIIMILYNHHIIMLYIVIIRFHIIFFFVDIRRTYVFRRKSRIVWKIQKLRVIKSLVRAIMNLWNT